MVKALCFGARAVLIGRAYLWGMAANGEQGVHNVLEILRGGIQETLAGLGKQSIAELSRADLVVPPGFSDRVGGKPSQAFEEPAPFGGDGIAEGLGGRGEVHDAGEINGPE